MVAGVTGLCSDLRNVHHLRPRHPDPSPHPSQLRCGGTAIISAQKKPSLFINVGRVAIRVLQMPFQTVLARLRKLFSKGEPSPESPSRPPHSRRGVFDMESLTDEQLQWVEEVYQREETDGRKGGREGGKEGGREPE